MSDHCHDASLDPDTALIWTGPSDSTTHRHKDASAPTIADGRPAVRTVYAALSGYLGRPPKVIDLGHSPHRKHFPNFIVEPESASVWPDCCDLALCSAPHRRDGAVHAREMLLKAVNNCASRVGIVLFETLWDDRALDRHDKLPVDLERLRSNFAFVHVIAEEQEDGGRGRRVLLFCSNRYWYADGHVGSFDTWTPCHNEIIGDSRQGTRRYFFSGDTVVKSFLFFGLHAADNRRDMDHETSFLSAPPIRGRSIPRVLAYRIGSGDAVLAVERLPGIPLSTVMARKTDYDPASVLVDMVERLDALERAGLFHNDLEPWNVLVSGDGSAALIDFAAITAENRPAWRPYSILLCFFLFAQALIDRRLPDRAAIPFPFLPYRLPRHYRRWAAMVWTYPRQRRNFALLKSCLEIALDGRPRRRQRDGVAGRLLRLYRRFSYGRSLINLQVSFFWVWIKVGGFRGPIGQALGSLIRSCTARPFTALVPTGVRRPDGR